MDLGGLYAQMVAGRYSGSAIDSREEVKNRVFFALHGMCTDGCAFLPEVARKGGVVAVVPSSYCGESYGLELVRVEDVLVALHALAKRHYRDLPVRSVAVTGSVGKTTIKEFLATLLGGKFSVAKTEGSANSQATFPLAVLNRTGREEVFVMEMGMSQAGELSRLVEIAPPDLALVGRIALAHAQFFEEGIEGIARAKAEILSQPRTQAALLHASTLNFAPFRDALLKEKSTYAAGAYRLETALGAVRVIEREKRSPEMPFPFAEAHLRENFLAAVAAARWFGMEWEEISAKSAEVTLLPRRFEKLEREGIRYINDSYNSNPASLAAALDSLPELGEGRRIAVIGEMRELGGFSSALHRELGVKALERVDILIAYGEETLPMAEVFAAAGRPVRHVTTLQDAKEALTQTARSGDLVLIKASRANALWTILE